MQLLSSSSFFYSSRTAARLCSACELLRSPFVRVHAHPMQNVLNSGECCVMSLWGKKLYYNIQGSFAFSIFNFKVFRDLKHVETIFWFSSFIVDTAFESQISFQSLNLLLEGWQIAIICLAVNCSLKYVCSQCTDRQAKQWQNHFGKVFFFKVRSVQNSRKGCDYFASLLALSNIQFEAWFMARVGAFFARVFLDFFWKCLWLIMLRVSGAWILRNITHINSFCEHDEYGAKMCVKVEKLGHLKEAHFNWHSLDHDACQNMPYLASPQYGKLFTYWPIWMSDKIAVKS